MRIVIASAAVLSIASACSAALVSADWQATGDGLLTRDTANNLDWLDWTQGLDLSYIDMQPELLPGGRFEGFRYATLDELNAFMLSGGVPDLGGRTEANVPSVTSILGLVGANDLFDFLGAGNSSAAFLYDASNAGPGSFITSALFSIEVFDSPVTAKGGELGASINNLAFGMGHALVRAVPAPGAAMLLGMGGLIATRRRR